MTAENRALPAVWTPPVWDEARIELVRKIICPPTASQSDFEYFVAWCQRTGLDPFVKQAYLVERKSKGDNGQWHVKHEPMAAEAGMGAVADAQADFLGIAGAAVYAGDQFEIDESAGTVKHLWSLDAREKNQNRVVGAWAHAKRSGRVTPFVWLRVEQRIQTRWDNEKRLQVPTSFWAKDAAGMIAKCARAMAYRLCYPNLFSGVPIREEMDADEIAGPPQPPPTPVLGKGADRLASKLGIPSKFVETPPVEFWPSEENSLEPAQPTPQQRPVTESNAISFGPSKGKPISEATLVELEDSIALGEQKLSDQPKAKWAQATRENVAALRAEVSRRLMAEPPEPGSEG